MNTIYQEPSKQTFRRESHGKMKPQFPMTASFHCKSKLNLMYLSRDHPKILRKIKVAEPVKSKIGTKGMQQLCQSFQGYKYTKTIHLDIQKCDTMQLRIFAKWLKTAKHLKSLQLDFAWGLNGINQGLSEVLSSLKELKSLICLTLHISEINPQPSWQTYKPRLQLRYLKNLRKLMLDRRPLVPMLSSLNNRSILRSIRGVYKISLFFFEFSFCNGQSKEDIQGFIDCLKKNEGLENVAIYLKSTLTIEDNFVEELISSFCDQKNLKRFYYLQGKFRLKAAQTQKLAHALNQNPSLQTVSLSGPSQGDLECLLQALYEDERDTMGLKSLDFHLLNYFRDLDDSMFRYVTRSFENIQSLEALQLTFGCYKTNPKNYRLLGQGLQALRNLSVLKINFLAGTKINTEEIVCLVEGIETLKTLSVFHLSLREGQFSNDDNGIGQIAESIASLEKLKDLTLDLGYVIIPTLPPPKDENLGFFSIFVKNKKEDPLVTGLDRFSQTFQRLPELVNLKLNLGNLEPSGRELECLGSGIELLKSLGNLELSFQITKKKDRLYLGFNKLYNSLKSLPFLSKLSLQFGSADHLDLETLFLHLQGFSRLKYLELCLKKVESMSYLAAEYFREATSQLVNLVKISLNISWGAGIEIKMISRFGDALNCIRCLTDFTFNFSDSNNDCEQMKREFLGRIKNRRVFSTIIRYRHKHFLGLKGGNY